MKNKKVVVIPLLVFLLGVILLFGSSYSLILKNNVTEEEYRFDVANFDVEFMDNTTITINGIPIDDSEALEKSKEYTFTVSNNSSFDVNYRIDIIETSTNNMQDVIKYAYKINNGAYSKAYLMSENYTINQNKVLKVGDKDIYTLKVWLSIDADENYMNKKFLASINMFATHNQNKYASSVIEYLYEKNMDGVKKVNDEYRYSAVDANNYVWFNCRDGHTKGGSYCEKWRIIGSFNNKSQSSDKEYYSLKIMNDNVVEQASFNNEEMIGTFDKSYIETYLNGYYYDSLTSSAKDLIFESRFYINDTEGLGFTKTIMEERQKVMYSYIGLINPSDYLYLGQNSWLKEGNILTMNKDKNQVNVINNGIIKGEQEEEYSVMPVVNLKADVSIISGFGSNDSPYELGIKYPMNMR